jgi:hypothetical protein
MTASRYIARLMGPALLAIGIGMVVGLMTEGDAYPALLKEFVGSRALIFLMGALTLVAGLAIVNAHNLWVPDWRVVVTVLGWLFIFRGILALVFPTLVQRLGEDVSAGSTGIIAGAVVTLVLGVFLSIMGYRQQAGST